MRVIRILGSIAGLAVALAVLAFVAIRFSPSLQDRVLTSTVAANLAKNNNTLLKDKSLKIILCGTGSPMPDPSRANACAAVVAGGHMVLIDAGPGAWAKIAQMRLPGGAIEAVFLTHLHSDHFGGLGEVSLQGWINGRKQALDVYGPASPPVVATPLGGNGQSHIPAGTDVVVAGLQEAYRADTLFRVEHHDMKYMPPAGEKMNAHVVPTPAIGVAETVYDRDGLKISAFLVNHHPIEPAFGYRVEYGGRVAVISGDTMKFENVATMSKDADLLVHEALNEDMVSLLANQVEASGNARLAKMARDTINYHTSPVEAAAIANEAHVKLLVLTHLVPPLPNAIARRMFMRGVSAARGEGETVLGDDGLMIVLPESETGYRLKNLL